MEGFYAAYMTGRGGQSILLLFVVKDGRLTEGGRWWNAIRRAC